MFHHIVLMKLTANAGQAFLDKAEAYAAEIRRTAPNLRRYVFRKNLASRSDGLTHAIVASFDSAAAHDRYQESALHQEMKNFMLPFIERIVACDIDEART